MLSTDWTDQKRRGDMQGINGGLGMLMNPLEQRVDQTRMPMPRGGWGGIDPMYPFLGGPRGVMGSIHGLGEQMGGLGETLGGYGEQIGGYGEQMGGFGETLGGYGEQMGGFQEMLGGFGKQMGGFGSQFKNINNKLTSLEKGIASLTDKFGTNQQQQNVYQQPMMPSFGNLFSGGFNPYFYGGLGMLMRGR